jgi:peptidoglycan-N-acetylglucosamine deacetylase
MPVEPMRRQYCGIVFASWRVRRSRGVHRKSDRNESVCRRMEMLRTRMRNAIALFIIFVCGIAAAATMARAEECPNNPNALGTSRVLAIDPSQFPKVGAMDHALALPLADKEVVLTFDDGPVPRYSNQVLDALAAQCVKATFFLVGEMAREYPATVRRIFADGHTIGTHSEDHPPRFGKLSRDLVEWEIDKGIIDVGVALGDHRQLAPFFRVPGLAHSDIIDDELAARHLVSFSSDTVADDWHRISSKRIIALAMSRLEARGKGILLLHDIHRATASALPDLLKDLKQKGFHVVHVVPSSIDQF